MEEQRNVKITLPCSPITRFLCSPITQSRGHFGVISNWVFF
jgi:hypothetical protein